MPVRLNTGAETAPLVELMSAPVIVPPVFRRLRLAAPVNAPTKVVLVTLVRPVIVAGSESVGVVVPVTVIWFAVPAMLVTPPVAVAGIHAVPDQVSTCPEVADACANWLGVMPVRLAPLPVVSSSLPLSSGSVQDGSPETLSGGSNEPSTPDPEESFQLNDKRSKESCEPVRVDGAVPD